MRLQRKILLILAPCIVIPMLALGLTVYLKLSATAEEKAYSQIDATLDNVEKGLNAYVATARANIELFAGSSLITRYLLVEDESERYALLQPSLLSLLSSYQRAFPNYRELRILLPDGYEDTRSTLSFIPNLTEDEGESAHFRRVAASKEKVHVEIFDNPDTGKLSLLISKPILIKDPGEDPALAKPKLRGFFVITSTLGFLRDYQENGRFGVGGHVVFADGSGGKLFADADGTDSPPLPPRLFAVAREGARAGTPRKVDVGGRTAVVQGRYLDKRLLVYATIPERELLGASRVIGVLVAIATVAAISFVAILLFALLKTLIIRPIQQLGSATREIGRGNLDVVIAVDRDDEIGDLAAAFRRMSAGLKSSAEQIEHMAYFDTLTGLPNRYSFCDLVDRAILETVDDEHPMAVLFMDLDDFKNVNDNLGHEAGDQLLKNVADRLSNCVRRKLQKTPLNRCEDMVARLGGDEFVVLLSRIRKPADADIVARRLVQAMSEPFAINDYSFHIGVSIGISTFPANGRSADMLIRNADVAMYHAKKNGKNNLQYFSEAMNQAALERFTLENALRDAIGTDQLRLHYQPQVDAKTGRLSGVEALIRWQHPKLGFLLPAAFVQIAEECGLIVRLGEWVLREACRQVVAWDRAGYKPVRIAVNISNNQFKSDSFAETVSEVLAETGLPAHRLELEVTESSVMHAENHGLPTLRRVKQLGVRIAMDDFGTGYSSLAALRQLPVDILKIDRSFVDGVVTDKADAKIASVILAMARLLKLEVVAEGVETEEQLDFLRRKGCHTIQGFFISRPLPATDVVALFARETDAVAEAETESGAA